MATFISKDLHPSALVNKLDFCALVGTPKVQLFCEIDSTKVNESKCLLLVIENPVFYENPLLWTQLMFYT